jgi:hypothetical protein
MMVDLHPFCGSDEIRPYLMKPFSFGDFSYATNGHILVRVPKREGVEPPDKKFNPDKPLADLEKASFTAPIFKLPPQPAADTECEACDGRGYEHDCPHCECTCHACAGTGSQAAEGNYSTSYEGVNFALRYVRKMLALPGIEIAKPRDKEAPLLFRFEGGVGAVMPLRGTMLNHVEVFGSLD